MCTGTAIGGSVLCTGLTLRHVSPNGDRLPAAVDNHLSDSVGAFPVRRIVHGYACRSGRRSAIGDAGYSRWISERDRQDGQGHLWLIWKFLPADSERGSIRPVLLRESRLPKEVGGHETDGTKDLLPIRNREN